MEYVCPYCLRGLGTESPVLCSCGKTFDHNEWPEEACTSSGLDAELTLIFADKCIPAPSKRFVIGRTPGEGGVVIENVTVSREHVRIWYEAGSWHVSRIGQSFLLNNRETTQGVLNSGDQLMIGSCLVRIVIQYHVIPPYQTAEGDVRFGNDHPFAGHSQYLIGSDSERCDIVISQASPIHARLYSHGKENDWWITDCNTTTGTKVNQEFVRNRRLVTGDTITIASVPILVSSRGLQVGVEKKEGLSLEAKSVSADGILHDINFSIKPGEFVGILGPSGSGKSSIIQRLVGLAPISSGKILVNGNDIAENKKAFLSCVSYLPQQISLHENLTLRQECTCFGLLHAQDWCETKSDIEPILRMVGLENEIGNRIGNLSGGQKRRAGIALELLRKPGVLFLDEPTSGLDPASETDVMTYLRTVASQGKTVVCSTHIMEHFEMFDKILLLSKGEQVFFGPPSELLHFFGLQKPEMIFGILAEGTPDQQKETAIHYAEKFRNSPYSQMAGTSRVPLEERPPISKLREIGGYLTRYMYEFFSFIHRRNLKETLKSFSMSSAAILFLIQPLLIVLAIKLSCAAKYYSSIDIKDLFFFTIISIFWLGMNNSIREFVSERVPYRCLERLRQASYFSYLSSKLLWTFGLCLVQTVIFSILMFGIIHNFPVDCIREGKEHNFTPDHFSLIWTWGISGILFLVCLIGNWIALAISSFCDKENSAIGWLPVVLIPVLLFSTPVIKNGESKSTTSDWSSWAVSIEKKSPCHYPLKLMETVNQYHLDCQNDAPNVEDTQKAEVELMKQTAIYSTLWLCVSLLIMIVFQEKRELAWKGR